MNHAENQMFNWSRDFIQTHTSKHGFCEDREYRRIFRLFQRCTAMKENPLIFSGYCKKNGFISRANSKITWLLPMTDKNRQ